MRRIAIIMAGAALALSLVVPAAVVAEAHGRGGHHGDRHGYSYGHSHHRDAGCYGCYGPGSRCGRHGCDYALFGYYGYGYGYGGYYPGGFGCNFDYPCGPPFLEYNCSKYTGPGMKPPADSGCKYDQKCDCYYHSSTPPPQAGVQPAPEQGAQPGPEQGAQPAPDQGMQPPPDQGAAPAPGEGAEQPRPY